MRTRLNPLKNAALWGLRVIEERVVDGGRVKQVGFSEQNIETHKSHPITQHNKNISPPNNKSGNKITPVRA